MEYLSDFFCTIIHGSEILWEGKEAGIQSRILRVLEISVINILISQILVCFGLFGQGKVLLFGLRSDIAHLEFFAPFENIRL